jgi:hypothetical protein
MVTGANLASEGAIEASGRPRRLVIEDWFLG